MESSLSKAIRWLMRLSGVKALTEWSDGDILSWIIDHNMVWDAEIPRWLARRHKYSEHIKKGNRYFYFPSSRAKNSNFVFYVHGGGFLMDMYFLYWFFVHRLMTTVNTSVIIPIYPLLPEAKFDDSYYSVEFVYKLLVDNIGEKDKLHIIADSSGAAMGMRLAQMAKKKGGKVPENLILISPWLDMDLKKEQLKKYEESDPFISVAALEHCVNEAVPGKRIDPLYSPIYGNLKNIGKISVFTGTADTLYPNSKALRKKALQERIPINYYEHRGMFHVFPQFPIKEAEKAMSVLSKIILTQPVDELGTGGFTVII